MYAFVDNAQASSTCMACKLERSEKELKHIKFKMPYTIGANSGWSEEGSILICLECYEALKKAIC